MELWIRSQNRSYLYKAEQIEIKKYDISDIHVNVEVNGMPFGVYKSRIRVEKILDEISNKIKRLYLCEINTLMKTSEIANAKDNLEKLNGVDFIMQPAKFKIEPINQNIIYYEMPKE